MGGQMREQNDTAYPQDKGTYHLEIHGQDDSAELQPQKWS
jgi:hypothetical protein